MNVYQVVSFVDNCNLYIYLISCIFLGFFLVESFIKLASGLYGIAKKGHTVYLLFPSFYSELML